MRQDGGPFINRTVVVLFLILGAYLSLRGYRALEGDQAYRFPILLAAQDPTLYPRDPFVSSFREFNPHRGAFAVIGGLADGISLSPALVGLFLATFCLTATGFVRLARTTWPDLGEGVGWVAAVLVLAATAGNVGTNHLFEPIVLDRQMALALIWSGLAGLIASPGRRALPIAGCLGAATLIHPTFGLQAGLILGAGLWAWSFLGIAGASQGRLAVGSILFGLAVLPGLWINAQGSSRLFEGLPVPTFRLLSVELQGPQHMLPHLWRFPQWLAWGCYPTLVLVSLVGRNRSPEGAGDGRSRLIVLIALTVVWVAISWVGVEWVGNLRFILFQPFRVATLARGLCLVLVAGHVLRLLERRDLASGARAGMIVVGLTGDWSLVVVTAFETMMVLGEAVRGRAPTIGRWFQGAIAPGVGLAGLVYLSLHDTESGHFRLIAVGLAGGLAMTVAQKRAELLSRGRLWRLAAVCWAVPVAAMVANLSSDSSSIREWLVKRCRFAESPIDDIERLAVWARTNTPKSAMFVGPPGQKTFRLWSRRSVAFNRAASPYTARGLGDWADRFADHVGFGGPPAALARAYQNDRHGLEKGYDRLSPRELAALADRQGAAYVLGRWPGPEARNVFQAVGLRLARREGRYALWERLDEVENSVAGASSGVRR